LDYTLALKHQLALVTGGASGIGFAIATQLAQAGAHVCILDIDPHHTDLAAEKISVIGQLVGTLIHSVGEPSVIPAIQEYAAGQGRHGFDLLVNAAGISPKKPDGQRLPAWEIPPAQWDEVLKINVHGVFHTMSAVIPSMIQSRRGAIVNIGSLAGRRYSSIAGAAYATSKAGVEAITRQFAGEVAEFGIRINAVAPGRIQTPMADLAGDAFNEQIRLQTPLRRLGRPFDVANAVMFLLSDAAAFMTGETLVVSGGRGL
jgi:3-oxoacyl-[acyl-carrier protein] reductase